MKCKAVWWELCQLPLVKVHVSKCMYLEMMAVTFSGRRKESQAHLESLHVPSCSLLPHGAVWDLNTESTDLSNRRELHLLADVGFRKSRTSSESSVDKMRWHLLYQHSNVVNVHKESMLNMKGCYLCVIEKCWYWYRSRMEILVLSFHFSVFIFVIILYRYYFVLSLLK